MRASRGLTLDSIAVAGRRVAMTPKRFALILSALAAPVMWAAAQAPTPNAQHRTPLDSHRALGISRSYRNLTLIPVYDSAARPTDSYMTLDEGLRAKIVAVAESTGGGDVNTLYVTNQGETTLYLMGGEVVLGGQQDRCIGQDTLIPPKRTRVPVAVFCVEHGRWVGKAHFDASAHMVAGKEVRLSAQDGAVKSAYAG